jgi:hypothetical protein
MLRSLRSTLLAFGLLAPLLAAAPASAHDTLAAKTAANRWLDLHHGALTQLRAAAAQDPHPLTGEGENIELIANVPVSFGSDLELHGDLAFVGSYDEGLVIIDIADPTNPRRIGQFDCGGGSQYDVQLHPEAKYALLTTDGANSKCHTGDQGSMVIDVQDPANPREVAFIPIVNDAGTKIGSHTHTLDWPYLYVNNYPTSYHKLEVFSLEDPGAPRKIGQLDFGAGEDSIHDSWVDHRPDGRTLLYAASIGASDVIDVTNPAEPVHLQRIVDPEVTISHQAEPSAGRDTLVVTDEFSGGGDAPACGQTAEATDSPLPPLPAVGDPGDVGGIHFYALGADGRVKAGLDGKLGTYNLPAQENPSGGCTVHVFWRAPSEDRLVTAWYGRGIRIVDFSNPAEPQELAWYIPTDANTWSAKPHRGYIFTGDINRGFDVLRYTGDGWPAGAGPAEVQRAATQQSFRPGGGGGGAPEGPAGEPGATPPGGSGNPANPAPPLSRPRGRTGSYNLSKSVRIPRGVKTVVLRVRGARKRVLGLLKFRVTRPGVRILRARIAGRAGRYRFDVRPAGRRRILARGSFRVRRNPLVSVLLPKGRRIVVAPRGNKTLS